MRHNEKSEGPSVRVLRVGEQVRHVLSEILARGDVHDDVLAKHPVSVTEVRMSPDLRHATVFVKPLLGRDEEAVIKALRTNTAYLQREVAHRIRMKYAAKLKFLPDESFDEASHIDKLLRDPKVMRDLGLVTYREPFTHLLTQGMVLNNAYFHKPEGGGKNYYWENDLDLLRDTKGQIIGARLKSDGSILEQELTTMSKSKNNGVDPQALIEQYGADTARFFMMFAAPPEQTLEWSDAGVEGAYRFLRRVWAFGHLFASEIRGQIGSQRQLGVARLPDDLAAVRREIHLLLKQANYDLGKQQFNTVASATMKMLNALEKAPRQGALAAEVIEECFGILLRVLSPLTPHISHVLWADLGYGEDILAAPWPEPQEAALVQDQIEFMLQVNGKLRGALHVPADAPREAIEAAALGHEATVRFLEGRGAKKVVVVPGRLVNIVG